jgi:hypothetical protein
MCLFYYSDTMSESRPRLPWPAHGVRTLARAVPVHAVPAAFLDGLVEFRFGQSGKETGRPLIELQFAKSIQESPTTGDVVLSSLS